MRPVITIVLAAALAGAFLSADLTYVHYKTYTDTDYHSFCALSDAWNCQTVAVSSTSVFLRLPVSLWGLLVYLAYLAAALLAWADLKKERRSGIRGLGVMACMAAGGIVASALLFYVSVAVIRSKCILCVGLYAINAAIFIALAGAAIVKKENPFRWVAVDARGILPSPRAVSGFVVLAAAAVALVVFYPRLYIDDINCNVTTPLPNHGHGTCNEEATYGPADAAVVITEFSDYQCPYCAMTHFTLRKAVDMYKGKVMLKHRHFPLDQACNPLLTRPFHKHACLAARAAVCAGKQSRFWEYNDLLWKNQEDLDRESITSLADSLGLDVGKFTSCLGDKATLELIRRDIQEATNTPFVQSGMVGTPIVYVGDSPHIGGITLSEVEKIINEQLARGAEKAVGGK